MAAVIILDRMVSHRGRYRVEKGDFVNASADTNQVVVTKLGRIIAFRMLAQFTGAGDRSGPIFINSNTQSLVQDDPGRVAINGAQFADGFEYTYEAVGVG